MYDSLVIGSITLDLFFLGDNFTKKEDRYELAVGGKYVADGFIQKIGGGGANVSIGLQRQGFNVVFWGVIDKSLIGQHILTELKKENINTDLMEQKENSLSVSAILLNSSGEKTVITHHAEVKRIYGDKVKNLMRSCRWLFLGNSEENSFDEKLVWVNDARENGVRIFSAITASDCKRGIKYNSPVIEKSDWVILNAHELADLVDIPYDKLQLETRNYDCVLNLKGVIVTDGANGAYAYTNMKRYFQRAIEPLQIVDTTGAGDSFASGFLAEYIRTSDIEKSLLNGSQNSASVISKIGAQHGLLKKS